MATDLKNLLANEMGNDATFKPYCETSVEADALTAYFKPDADYSQRLTDHVTLYRSLATNEIVGCRIKGISGILEDLPNYLNVSHEGANLSMVFWSFRGALEDQEQRDVFKQLVEAGGSMPLQPV